MESIPHFFLEKGGEKYLFIMEYDCHINNLLPPVLDFLSKSLPKDDMYYSDYYPSVARYLIESLDTVIGKQCKEVLSEPLAVESLTVITQIVFIRYNLYEVYKCSLYVPDEYRGLI